MKALQIILACLLAGGLCASQEKGPVGPSYYILETIPDSSLNDNVCAFDFIINANDLFPPNVKIRYSDNELELITMLDGTNSFRHLTSPGKHKFQFVLTPEFYELYTDSIFAPSGHRVKVQLNFRSSIKPIQVKKPVIYLYPQEKTEVNVSLATKGDLFFTYPHYNDGWNATVNPNGDIHIGANTYNYLFWESTQQLDYSIIDFSKGSVVSNDAVLSFLEESLTQYGLNSKEQSDFITYWVPQMIESNYLYIYFVFDDKCDAFAELNINPKPDKLGRFYMLWSSVKEGEITKVTPQKIPILDRSGFTVIEWGGAEVEMINRPETEL